ncbi:MAG: transposase, partial [Spirochaetaceae bacterium]|nr:transposase [Spirochaetaceae bacterium]
MGKQDKARRVYPTEFKAEAAVLAGKHGKPARQIALDLGVNENRLYRWTQRAREAAGTGLPPFPGHPHGRRSRVPTDEGAASPRTKEPRPHGRKSRVPTDEGAASLRTKEARPHGRRSRVPTDEGGASPRTKEARPHGCRENAVPRLGRTPQAAASGARVSAAERSFASSSR